MKPITVYWAPFTTFKDEESEWTYLYPKPKTLFSDLLTNKNKESLNSSFFACPAISDKFKKTLVFRNSFDSSYRFDFSGDNRIFEHTSEHFISNKKVRVSPLTDGPSIEFGLHYIFFADEPLNVSFTPPYFHKPQYTVYGSNVPGDFDIGQWFRPYNFEVQMWKDKGEFHMKEDEPLFYVEFNTDRDIIFKRFNCTPKLQQYSQSNLFLTKLFGRGQSLLSRYSKFNQSGMREKILFDIKNNLLD
jgi:hypothetical protein